MEPHFIGALSIPLANSYLCHLSNANNQDIHEIINSDYLSEEFGILNVDYYRITTICGVWTLEEGEEAKKCC